MRKILTLLSVVSLISFNANALDASNFSITAGLAANSAVYGASAKETNRADDNTIKTVKKESGVFTDSHQSMLIELNVGPYVSLGYEHTPDTITTPEADRVNNKNGTTTAKVDFNDLNTAYLKLNIPGGVYFKAGVVETDLDIKESMASGSTYTNASTEGTLIGVGYNKFLGESAFSVRVEGSYMELDNVTTSNGVSVTGGTPANGGRNQVDGSDLQGLNAKLGITYTLGK